MKDQLGLYYSSVSVLQFVWMFFSCVNIVKAFCYFMSYLLCNFTLFACNIMLMECLLFKGQSIDDIHHDVLMDCAQLTKANSIQGREVKYETI